MEITKLRVALGIWIVFLALLVGLSYDIIHLHKRIEMLSDTTKILAQDVDRLGQIDPTMSADTPGIVSEDI